MLEKPKNYEEAKKIIENTVGDDMQEHKLKVAKLRSLVAVGVGAAAAVTAGVMTEDPTFGAIVLGNAMMIAAPFTFPYFFRKETAKNISNGSYFDDKSEEKIIHAANDYVERYNEFEESKGRSR